MQGEKSVDVGSLVLLRFIPRTVKEKIGKGEKPKTMPYTPSVCHISCVANTVFKHFAREFSVPPRSPAHRFSPDFFVHPNVRQDGWATFVEIHLQALHAIGQVTDLERHVLRPVVLPKFWTLVDSDVPLVVPPALFMDWTDTLNRGIPLVLEPALLGSLGANVPSVNASQLAVACHAVAGPSGFRDSSLSPLTSAASTPPATIKSLPPPIVYSLPSPPSVHSSDNNDDLIKAEKELQNEDAIPKTKVAATAHSITSSFSSSINCHFFLTP